MSEDVRNVGYPLLARALPLNEELWKILRLLGANMKNITFDGGRAECRLDGFRNQKKKVHKTSLHR